MAKEQLISFLITAKQHTYASGKAAEASSRPNSHDLHYTDGDYQYIDTYLGSFHFIGEEAVWEKGKAVWGMNYYGKMLVEEIPQGFGEFLKAALLRVPRQAPFRGPEEFSDGQYHYYCRWSGPLGKFSGQERILHNDKLIYELAFHGGEIRD